MRDRFKNQEDVDIDDAAIALTAFHEDGQELRINQNKAHKVCFALDFEGDEQLDGVFATGDGAAEAAGFAVFEIPPSTSLQ